MNYCEDCVIRLFNNKHYNLQGIGNPYFGNCIIVPNVDYNAYKKGGMEFSKQVEIIKSLISSTGELDDLYVLPLIRCNEYISCELNEDSYLKCIGYLVEDMKKYQFKNIMLLGSAGRRFLNCNISDYFDTIFISVNNRRYWVNYSPFINYTDSDKYEIFKSNLIRWYNSIKNNDFTNYKILNI
mgnify:FL=1